MIHIITSNSVPVSSIQRYADNFMIVHHYKREVPSPFSEIKLRHVFQTYIQTDMEYDESEFQDSSDFEFHIHEEPSIIPSLDEIINAIVDQWKKERQEDDDVETIVVCACDMAWNRSAVWYMNKCLHARGVDVDCMDLYVTLRAGSADRIKSIISAQLDTEFIYPDEPVSFAYAIDRALIGLV